MEGRKYKFCRIINIMTRTYTGKELTLFSEGACLKLFMTKFLSDLLGVSAEAGGFTGVPGLLEGALVLFGEFDP